MVAACGGGVTVGGGAEGARGRNGHWIGTRGADDGVTICHIWGRSPIVIVFGISRLDKKIILCVPDMEGHGGGYDQANLLEGVLLGCRRSVAVAIERTGLGLGPCAAGGGDDASGGWEGGAGVVHELGIWARAWVLVADARRRAEEETVEDRSPATKRAGGHRKKELASVQQALDDLFPSK